MRISRRCAIWFAAAVSVLAFASAGLVRAESGGAASGGGERLHHVVADPDAVAPARPAAERSPLDLRQVTGKLLLGWIAILLCAALRVATAGRTIPMRVQRAGSTVPTRRRFVRGPPAPAFA